MNPGAGRSSIGSMEKSFAHALHGIFKDLAGLARRSCRKVILWRQRAAQRRALDGLTEIQLRDIGLSPTQARQEAKKPFWRA